MKYEDYKIESARTFAYRKEPLPVETTDSLHCVIGIVTEAGELMDAFKKHIFYGKAFDTVNAGEEIADIMWYIANFCRINNLDFENLLQNNIDKLRIRFPDKFTQENAINRNLEAERKELEK